MNKGNGNIWANALTEDTIELKRMVERAKNFPKVVFYQFFTDKINRTYVVCIWSDNNVSYACLQNQENTFRLVNCSSLAEAYQLMFYAADFCQEEMETKSRFEEKQPTTYKEFLKQLENKHDYSV